MKPSEQTTAAALPSLKPSNPRRDAFEVGLTRVLAAPMERASWSGCRHTGAWLGLLIFHALGSRRDMGIANIRIALPHISQRRAYQILRRSMQNMGMLLCEFLHLKVATPQEISAYAEIEGYEHIEQGFARGRGVLLLTAHFGNWEVMGARAVQSFPMTVMIRPTSNAGFQSYIEGIRRHVGIKMISKHATARTSLKVLRANEALAIFPDQYDTSEELLLPFFGRPTRFISSFSRLTLMAQAPLVPGYGVRRIPWLADGRIRIQVKPGLYLHEGNYATREDAVVAGTRWAIQQLEELLRQYPEQWLWIHRRWRDGDIADALRTLSGSDGLDL